MAAFLCASGNSHGSAIDSRLNHLRERVATIARLPTDERPADESDVWILAVEELKRLPKRLREPLVMYHMEDRTLAQITELLGATPANQPGDGTTPLVIVGAWNGSHSERFGCDPDWPSALSKLNVRLVWTGILGEPLCQQGGCHEQEVYRPAHG